MAQPLSRLSRHPQNHPLKDWSKWLKNKGKTQKNINWFISGPDSTNSLDTYGTSMCNSKIDSLKTVYRLSVQSVMNKPKLLSLIVLLGKDTKSSIFTIQYFIR